MKKCNDLHNAVIELDKFLKTKKGKDISRKEILSVEGGVNSVLLHVVKTAFYAGYSKGEAMLIGRRFKNKKQNSKTHITHVTTPNT